MLLLRRNNGELVSSLVSSRGDGGQLATCRNTGILHRDNKKRATTRKSKRAVDCLLISSSDTFLRTTTCGSWRQTRAEKASGEQTDA